MPLQAVGRRGSPPELPLAARAITPLAMALHRRVMSAPVERVLEAAATAERPGGCIPMDHAHGYGTEAMGLARLVAVGVERLGII